MYWIKLDIFTTSKIAWLAVQKYNPNMINTFSVTVMGIPKGSFSSQGSS